jgi:hypothetical protein
MPNRLHRELQLGKKIHRSAVHAKEECQNSIKGKSTTAS